MCSTVAAEGEGEQPDRGEPGAVDPAGGQRPGAAERRRAAMPTRIDAGGDRGDPGRQPPHPAGRGTAPGWRAGRTGAARTGRARLVRTSSWPWMDSSITAARSDQASSSAIRAGAIRAGRAGAAARRAGRSSTTIPTPAGHQTNSAVSDGQHGRRRADWAIRTPLLAQLGRRPGRRRRRSGRAARRPGWSPGSGRSCPRATRHSRRRTSADQSAVSPAVSRPDARGR